MYLLGVGSAYVSLAASLQTCVNLAINDNHQFSFLSLQQTSCMLPKKRQTTPLTSRGDMSVPSLERRGAYGVDVQQAFVTFLEYTPCCDMYDLLRDLYNLFELLDSCTHSSLYMAL
jgi:hypothetical protein